MKHLYITLLLLLAYTCAFAQKDFRQGYILLQGDTIPGLIDYRGDKRSAQLALYKASPDGEQTNYAPTDIGGYGFIEEKKVFETHTIPPTDSAAAPQTLFLRVLAKGRASIYFYLDGMQRTHYYLLMPNQQLTELKEKEYMERQENGKLYKVVRKDYQNLLLQVFADCPDITQKQIENLRLSEEMLIPVAEKYNRCMGAHDYAAVTKKSNFTYGVSLFHATSSLHFSGESYLDGNTFHESGARLGGGLAFNLAPSSFNDKLSFQVELLYDPSSFSLNFVGPKEYTSRSPVYETDFKLAFLKLPVQVRYVYPKGKIRPFFNAGGLASYALRRDHQTTKNFYFAGQDLVVVKPALANDGFKNFSMGLTGGAGLRYELYGKPLWLEARYEKTNGISDLILLASTLNTFYVILSYTL